jgi:hypothetical protein
MPYVPPTGNTVLFNFGGTYAPPTGNVVVIDFSILPDIGGGSGHEQLPGYRARINLQEEDAWQPTLRRNFAPAIGLGGTEAQPWRRPLTWMRYEEPEPLPWRPLIRHTPRNALRSARRHAAQIIG